MIEPHQSAQVLRNLDLALSLGSPLPVALDQIAADSPSGWRSQIEVAAQAARRGSKLGEVLVQSSLFPAELGPALLLVDYPQALSGLARILEVGAWRDRQIRLILTYPLFLLAISLAVVWLVCGLVGSAFSQLVVDLAQTQPMPTRWAIAASGVVGHPLFLTAEVAALAGLYALLAGLGPLVHLRPYLPLVGSWVCRSESVLWLDWLEFYLSRAESMPESMSQAALACSDRSFQQRVRRAISRVAGGDSLGQATVDLLPDLGCFLLQRGEAREFPAGYLAGVASVLRREQEVLAQSGLQLLEMASIGSTVVILPPIVVGYLLPLYQLVSTIGE